jgi:hypothetical protein
LGLWGPRELGSESIRELLQVPRRLHGPTFHRLEAEFPAMVSRDRGPARNLLSPSGEMALQAEPTR